MQISDMTLQTMCLFVIVKIKRMLDITKAFTGSEFSEYYIYY